MQKLYIFPAKISDDQRPIAESLFLYFCRVYKRIVLLLNCQKFAKFVQNKLPLWLSCRPEHFTKTMTATKCAFPYLASFFSCICAFFDIRMCRITVSIHSIEPGDVESGFSRGLCTNRVPYLWRLCVIRLIEKVKYKISNIEIRRECFRVVGFCWVALFLFYCLSAHSLKSKLKPRIDII